MDREDNGRVNDGLQHGSFEWELQMEGLITHTHTRAQADTRIHSDMVKRGDMQSLWWWGFWGVDGCRGGPDFCPTGLKQDESGTRTNLP